MKLSKKDLEKKIKEGWILVRMWFDVLAKDKEVAKKSLEIHIKKLEEFPDVIILDKKFLRVKKVKNPLPNVDVGYSRAAEVELLGKNIEALVYVTIVYGPSGIEVLKPEKFNFSMFTVQSILNTFADLVHRFASQKGGFLIPIPYATKRK